MYTSCNAAVQMGEWVSNLIREWLRRTSVYSLRLWVCVCVCELMCFERLNSHQIFINSKTNWHSQRSMLGPVWIFLLKSLIEIIDTLHETRTDKEKKKKTRFEYLNSATHTIPHSVCCVLSGECKLVHMRLQLGQLCGTWNQNGSNKRRGRKRRMRAYEKDRRAVEGAEGGRQWVKK